MGVPWYTTRERVASAMSAASSVAVATEIDDAIAAATDSINRLCQRDDFAPWIGTRYFPEGSPGRRRTRALYFDQYSLTAEPTAVTVDGTAVTVSDLIFLPVNGPPFTAMEPDETGSASVHGAERGSVAVTGTWGHCTDVQATAGITVGAVNASVTTLVVDGTAASRIGVGTILTAGTERLTVTGRGAITTSQTVQTPMTASAAGTGLAVTTGSAFAVGELLLVDTESMIVAGIGGNTLVVDRAVDGSVLASHTGSTIYAYRSLTVVRGDRGSTAASHTDGTALTRWVPPPGIGALARAEAINTVLSEAAGYARTVGSGEAIRNASGAGLKVLRDQVQATYGRMMRHRAV